MSELDPSVTGTRPHTTTSAAAPVADCAQEVVRDAQAVEEPAPTATSCGRSRGHRSRGATDAPAWGMPPPPLHVDPGSEALACAPQRTPRVGESAAAAITRGVAAAAWPETATAALTPDPGEPPHQRADPVASHTDPAGPGRSARRRRRRRSRDSQRPGGRAAP
ncbi:hypothetical protein C2845_PM12G29010 [Panicum miliaceum]|uniref:Uncharacterized protein n=1 Tax=Panicum miliaceum TaxID=4540 RepID=A0A3L6QFQ9_PANMI|nr:hypothetical protein C2845_PM12G29010 [Panicum miliaceum]